jgi:hypothetical protein
MRWGTCIISYVTLHSYLSNKVTPGGLNDDVPKGLPSLNVKLKQSFALTYCLQ